jgi:hypothetical protein
MCPPRVSWALSALLLLGAGFLRAKEPGKPDSLLPELVGKLSGALAGDRQNLIGHSGISNRSAVPVGSSLATPGDVGQK